MTLPLAACGSEDDKAADAVRGYLTALADGDGQKACDFMTGEQQRAVLDALAAQVPEAEATSCADGVEKVAENLGRDEAARLADAEVTATVFVSGDEASAKIEGAPQTAMLTKTEAGWLISGGLTP